LVKNEWSGHSLVASLHGRCRLTAASPHSSVDEVWGRGPGAIQGRRSVLPPRKVPSIREFLDFGGRKTVAIDVWKPNLRHAISLACQKQASSGCCSNMSVAN
jgi:hypothetical protein